MLPLHNPIRVAEDAATVDIISNGRLDLGFGVVAFSYECETFGVKIAESFGVKIAESFGRSYEALTIRCFTEDEVDYRGKYFNFEKVRMTTKPVQKPGVPIYMGVMARQSIQRAARRGYHFAAALMGPHWEKNGETQRQLGRSRDSYLLVSGPLFVHVAETWDKAWDEAEEGIHWAIDFYHGHGSSYGAAEDVITRPPPVGRLRHESEKIAYGRPAAVGSVDDVLRVLSSCRNEDIDELALTFNFPGMKFEHVKRSMRIFAREIMPEIRKW